MTEADNSARHWASTGAAGVERGADAFAPTPPVAGAEEPTADPRGDVAALRSYAAPEDRMGELEEIVQEQAPLLDTIDMQEMTTRWHEIQTRFVDEPRMAVRDADALVADLMQRLTQMFAGERSRLEVQWADGDDVSTEDLRQGLQRYRTFFKRLLAA